VLDLKIVQHIGSFFGFVAPFLLRENIIEAPIYEEGMLVQHDKYGMGRIIFVGGQGAMCKRKIRFQAVGERTFVAHMAKLEIVRGVESVSTEVRTILCGRRPAFRRLHNCTVVAVRCY
jgi:hypothetical protein